MDQNNQINGMMKLSIITINYNNAIGLLKTIESVFSQTSHNFEYIVVDGGSTDNSVEIIKSFDRSSKERGESQFTWISEPDTGIYNAMNKGIKMAKGEYLQFLNSGDCLVSSNVTDIMLTNLNNSQIVYGNMMKIIRGHIVRDRSFAGRMPTMLDFYTGTLNHSSAYIKRGLFEMYGFYDESLKIVSDWKWYLQVILLNGVVPEYKDVDVTNFDLNGISNVNTDLNKAERKQVLSEILPESVIHDYENWYFHIDQLKRINRYLLTRKGFWFVERVLFKLEKWFKMK
jgi:glycosyltransferase involved in cell wall biosynthesis